MRLCELKQKEVINICTCKSLGCPADVDIDCKSGCIIALIVPGPGRICGLFGRETECIIPWECVNQVGDDIILVEINEEKCFHPC
ncbi:MAG: YlmC/YmxH family sporulation protein [Lachnospiraceae bacterium]|nr:YlmC/YmxH family sporulation protein [Lachnospiraceae bacterium]